MSPFYKDSRKIKIIVENFKEQENTCGKGGGP